MKNLRTVFRVLNSVASITMHLGMTMIVVDHCSDAIININTKIKRLKAKRLEKLIKKNAKANGKA